MYCSSAASIDSGELDGVACLLLLHGIVLERLVELRLDVGGLVLLFQQVQVGVELELGELVGGRQVADLTLRLDDRRATVSSPWAAKSITEVTP